MSEFYQVVKIDGKGFGCVATKDIKRGTLILREKAPIVIKEAKSECGTTGWVKSVVTSFKQMSKNNQEEFLKLHNCFLDQDLSSDQKHTMKQSRLRSVVSQMYESGHEREEILAILGICITYGFVHDGFIFVPIHASRFNHSCSPNTTLNQPKSGEIFVRSITKIKAGEEINICYDEGYCIMKNRQTRQKYLKEIKNFICACNYCKDGNEDIEATEAFEKLSEDEERFTAMTTKLAKSNNQTEIIPFVKKAICCYKDMYNLGKKKKIAVSFLYQGVCLPLKIITITKLMVFFFLSIKKNMHTNYLNTEIIFNNIPM